jgi:hypothetical protein
LAWPAATQGTQASLQRILSQTTQLATQHQCHSLGWLIVMLKHLPNPAATQLQSRL